MKCMEVMCIDGEVVVSRENFQLGALPRSPRITVKLNLVPNQTEARSGAAALANESSSNPLKLEL